MQGMARIRSPERDEAMKIWIESDGKLAASDIAKRIGIKPERIRKWKSEDHWKAVLEEQNSKRKRGGQPRNKNAEGAGAPYGNNNAETHGAYLTMRLDNLPPDRRAFIESITLDTGTNMLLEFQLLMAKEDDLKCKIRALEDADSNLLYVDRVVEMLIPESDEQLKSQREKLEILIVERDNLVWDIDVAGKRPTKQQQQKIDNHERQIAELQDKISDAESQLSCNGVTFKTNMQTVIKASSFERAMKLESELNKIHGRIIKLLDSIKSYELDLRRVRLEERKYNLAKQKLTGEYEVDPETGEIDDQTDTEDANFDV